MFHATNLDGTNQWITSRFSLCGNQTHLYLGTVGALTVYRIGGVVHLWPLYKARSTKHDISGQALIFLEILPPFVTSGFELCHMWRRLGTSYLMLKINMGLFASCWFISLHPTLHDARSQEPKSRIFQFLTFFSVCMDNSFSMAVSCMRHAGTHPIY